MVHPGCKEYAHSAMTTAMLLKQTEDKYYVSVISNNSGTCSDRRTTVAIALANPPPPSSPAAPPRHHECHTLGAFRHMCRSLAYQTPHELPKDQQHVPGMGQIPLRRGASGGGYPVSQARELPVGAPKSEGRSSVSCFRNWQDNFPLVTEDAYNWPDRRPWCYRNLSHRGADRPPGMEGA